MPRIPTTFTIPDTIEGVRGLLTAQGWEKAAIVYAYTKPDLGGRPAGNRPENRPVFPCSIREFARLGIVGLSNHDTVGFYRAQWVKAIENGWAKMVGPGDDIDMTLLFEEKFPANALAVDEEADADIIAAAEEEGASEQEVKRLVTKVGKGAIKAAIKADPKVADAAWEALGEMQTSKRDRYVRDHGGGGKPVDPAWKDSEVDNAMDYAVEENRRRTRIRELLVLAEQGRARMQELSSEFSHTGVHDEVELMHLMTAALTDWQWSATAFIVEPAGESR